MATDLGPAPGQPDEYTQIVQRMGGQVFRIGPGLDSFNPLDLRSMGPAGIPHDTDSAWDALDAASGRTSTPVEESA